eukprot:6434699-Alexandrium_andersonii.AAC.1
MSLSNAVYAALSKEWCWTQMPKCPAFLSNGKKPAAAANKLTAFFPAESDRMSEYRNANFSSPS